MAIPLVFIAAISIMSVSSAKFDKQTLVGNYPAWVSADAGSDVFVFDQVAPTTGSLSAGDASVPDAYLSDPAIDSLVNIMQTNGTSFFKTATIAAGIVGANDVVIIKANFQWRHRLGTNTDRIKGVIWQVLNHPDGFQGEVLVCDNQESQIWPEKWLAGFTDNSNNSDDTEQSIVDVVNTFKAKGYPVDFYVWDSLNVNTVDEYENGDLSDGYIFNSTTLTSYPKFKSPQGNYISLKNGIWDNETSTYNKDKLCIINFPVLKAHGMVGATIAMKNYIGVMNTTKHDEWFGGWVDDTFHPLYCFSEYALVARELEICWPDLNIVDATWIGTASNYNHTLETIQANTILASTDPAAVSWYAAKYILQPIAAAPGRVDPDYTDGGNDTYGKVFEYWFNYLHDSTQFMVNKGVDNTSVYKSVGDVERESTSVEIKIGNNALAVYPNPVSDVLHVELNTGNINANADINLLLYNAQGALLERFPLAVESTQINFSAFPKGIYYLGLSGMQSRKKILKK